MVENNIAADVGGGIRHAATGFLTISDTTIRGNTAQKSSYYSPAGGGIMTDRTLLLDSCTVVSNLAPVGCGAGIGAYSSNADILIQNCTISGNEARDGNDIWGGRGGGIYVRQASVDIYNSTISDNLASNDVAGAQEARGGGVVNNSGTVELYSTIVANNKSTQGPDIQGTFAVVNHSLIEDNSGYTITSGADNIEGSDPMLSILAENGGPTLTMSIAKASPARNTGYNPLSLFYDQRGVGYARDDGNGVDIGAFEWLPSSDGTLIIVQ
jgi:hypothetical protein